MNYNLKDWANVCLVNLSELHMIVHNIVSYLFFNQKSFFKVNGQQQVRIFLMSQQYSFSVGTRTSHTAISSPRQSGAPCLLRTLSSLIVSSSVPQPKISNSLSSSSSPSSSSSWSSLSSVFDSHSEAIPDSRNLAKSRELKDFTSQENRLSEASDESWSLLSDLLTLSGGGGEGSRGGGGPGGPGRKRKRSSLSKHWSLPSGLPRVPLEEEKGLVVPSLGPIACRLMAETSGLGVVGSQITGGTVDRNVISNKLSCEPTGKRNWNHKMNEQIKEDET